MIMFKTTKIYQNDKGFASLAISLVLILVLALITVGFAQLARREQKDALNKQLSNQAYYAAESGVNDAVAAVPALTAGPPINPNKCLTSAQLGGVSSTLGSINQGTSYSCVLANLTPQSLVKDPLSADTGWNTMFSTNAPAGESLSSITVNWSSLLGKGARPAGATDLPPLASWSYPAVLQFSLTPLAPQGVSNSNLTRNNLINNTFSAYLYPSSSGVGSVNYGVNTTADIITSNGCLSNVCSVTINNINSAPNATNDEMYLLHIYDIYDNSTVSITNARSSVTNTQLDFTDSQAQIDSTGKSHEVLKRIQAVVPLNSTLNQPNVGLEANKICKRYDTYPNNITWQTPATFPYGPCVLNI